MPNSCIRQVINQLMPELNPHALVGAPARMASSYPNGFHKTAHASQRRVGQPLFGVSRVYWYILRGLVIKPAHNISNASEQLQNRLVWITPGDNGRKFCSAKLIPGEPWILPWAPKQITSLKSRWLLPDLKSVLRCYLALHLCRGEGADIYIPRLSVQMKVCPTSSKIITVFWRSDPFGVVNGQ